MKNTQQQKIKKLKLYGKRNGFWGFFAEIYVENDKVVVKSKDKKVKNEVLKRINEVLKNEGGFWLPAPDSPTDIAYKHKFYKVDDSWFLDTLREHFTPHGKLGCLIDGYLIIPLGSTIG